MTEEWRAVAAIPVYEVSNLGRVRNTRSGRILKPKITRQGYHEVRLAQGGKSYHSRVHRLVCEAFNGPPPFEGAFCLHTDDVPHHNWPDNLRWGDRRQNAKDALSNNRYRRGEKCGNSRYSEDVVRKITALRKEGKTLRELVALTGVSKAHCSKIVNGQAWSHVYVD